jgi:hypothetical protein
MFAGGGRLYGWSGAAIKTGFDRCSLNAVGSVFPNYNNYTAQLISYGANARLVGYQSAKLV